MVCKFLVGCCCKCSWPIRLQNSQINYISSKNWWINIIFDMVIWILETKGWFVMFLLDNVKRALNQSDIWILKYILEASVSISMNFCMLRKIEGIWKLIWTFLVECGQKRSWSVRLQNSWTNYISSKNWWINLIFGMQI